MSQTPFTALPAHEFSSRQITLETITPETAEKYLSTNESNRLASTSFVKQYVEDMQKGNWKLNADAIAFDNRGILINGQHRLMAVADAGVPVEFFVARGLDPEAFFVMDAGKKRSVADALNSEGHFNSKTLAELARAIVAYLSFQKFAPSVSTGNKSGTNSTVTAQESVAVVRRWTSLLTKSTTFAAETYKLQEPAGLFTKRELALFHFFYAHQFEGFENTLRKMATGEGLTRDEPIYVIRKRFTEDKLRNRSISSRQRASLLLRGLNAQISGNKIGLLRLQSKDAFPSLLGVDFEHLVNFWDEKESRRSVAL